MDFILLKQSGGTVITGLVSISDAFAKHASTVTVTLALAATPHNVLQTVKLPFSRFFEFSSVPVSVVRSS